MFREAADALSFSLFVSIDVMGSVHLDRGHKAQAVSPDTCLEAQQKVTKRNNNSGGHSE